MQLTDTTQTQRAKLIGGLGFAASTANHSGGLIATEAAGQALTA